MGISTRRNWESLKRQWEGYMGITAVTAAMLFLLSPFLLFPFLFSIEGNAAENKDSSSGGVSGNNAAASGSSAGASGDAADDSATAGYILAVELPIVERGETSLFDFILDPYGLLYETAALRYGGGRVEEGATMFFCNEEGEYEFSSCSDKLSIINHGETSVMVMVSAAVSDLEDIDLAEDAAFSGNGNPAIYLALTDDQGNECPIVEGEKAWIRTELGPGAYSFGLVGACNPKADWREVNVHPKVTVTWYVEPATENEEEEGETEK